VNVIYGQIVKDLDRFRLGIPNFSEEGAGETVSALLIVIVLLSMIVIALTVIRVMLGRLRKIQRIQADQLEELRHISSLLEKR